MAGRGIRSRSLWASPVRPPVSVSLTRPAHDDATSGVADPHQALHRRGDEGRLKPRAIRRPSSAREGPRGLAGAQRRVAHGRGHGPLQRGPTWPSNANGSPPGLVSGRYPQGGSRCGRVPSRIRQPTRDPGASVSPAPRCSAAVMLQGQAGMAAHRPRTGDYVGSPSGATGGAQGVTGQPAQSWARLREALHDRLASHKIPDVPVTGSLSGHHL